MSKKTKSSNAVRMELISHDMFGLKIFDHTPDKKCLVHIAVAPQGITCSHCSTDNLCAHIQFVMEHPELQKTFDQKRRAGWNIPDP